MQVHDASDPTVKKLGVDALPAIVGWLSNGEKHVLKAGITVKDLKSAIHDLSGLIEGFEKKNKNAASGRAKKAPTDSGENQIPLLTEYNFDALCGDKVPVCIIGAFRSSKERKKLESILNTVSIILLCSVIRFTTILNIWFLTCYQRISLSSAFPLFGILDIQNDLTIYDLFTLSQVSQKSLSRRQNSPHGRDSISYALLDATKQSSFLNAFDKAGFKALDKVLVAYKPRKGTFAAFEGEMTMEESEKFISSILNGDVRFIKTRQRPFLK